MAVLIFKALEKCNSNCEYCDTIVHKKQEVMSLELLEQTFVRINEYLEADPQETLTFTWHGGEVCLLGAAYIRKAKTFMDAHCPDTKGRIRHEIQSNLTLLTEDLAEAFFEFGVTGFGTSYEPVPNVRGFGPDRDSESYNKAFLRSISFLNERKIHWGTIYVVHRKSLGKAREIWNHMTNMNPGYPPAFVMMRSWTEPDHPLAITEEEYADFLGEVFAIYWKHRDRYGSVRPFDAFIETILERRQATLCESGGNCAYHWLFIGPEGNYGHCGVSEDYRIFNFGNIRDLSFREVLANPVRDDIAKRQTQLPEGDCKDCRFWGLCHGGCPVGAFLAHGRMDRSNPSCKVIRHFGEKYFEPITQVKADLYFQPTHT